jgi:hypothetical protein
MKKLSYIKPEVCIVFTSTRYHLCIGSSNNSTPVSGGDEMNDVTDGGNNPGDFSRRCNDWDDEEEDW